MAQLLLAGWRYKCPAAQALGSGGPFVRWIAPFANGVDGATPSNCRATPLGGRRAAGAPTRL